MILQSEIKHSILLLLIIGVISLLAFTLEGSEINDITEINISGNIYLSEEKYLDYSRLNGIENQSEMTIALIRDRLSKHPYIKNLDVELQERGIVSIKIFEKKMDAVLLNNSKQYLITENAEIIPLILSTKNIDLPVIINNGEVENSQVFTSARANRNLYCALKIISTAEIFDLELYKNISEIILNNGNNISIQLTDFSSTIYFGNENEIEKTVYLSKIFKHMKQIKITDHLDYIDLRYNDLVYLGFDEKFIMEKENI